MYPTIFIPDQTVEFGEITFLAGPHPQREGSRVLFAPRGVLAPTTFQCAYGPNDCAKTVEEAVERMCLLYPYWYYRATVKRWGHN